VVDLPELAARGERVHVRTIRAADVAACRLAVLASAERMRRWNPVNPDDLPRLVRAQSRDQRSFLVLANEPDPDQPIVGRVNLNGAVRGRFRSVAVGYDSYDPYAGRGLFAEGLRLVVDLALAEESAGGMDLHRVEANVQPGNTQSAGLLRSLGFRHEGASPRLLYLPDEQGQEAWRDHERFAITREEWPAQPYAPPRSDRLVVLLDTLGTGSGLELGRAIGRELELPTLTTDLGRPSDLPALVADCPRGAVVAGPINESDFASVLAALHSAFPDAVAGSVADVHPDGQGITRTALALRAAGRTGR
jgi:[ribosomal protein S5]-alanine N-acetyltransferase